MQYNNSDIVDNCSTALIIKNDSVITTGDKLIQTFDDLEGIEFSAQPIVFGNSLGEMGPINNDQIEDLRKKSLFKLWR